MTSDKNVRVGEKECQSDVKAFTASHGLIRKKDEHELASRPSKKWPASHDNDDDESSSCRLILDWSERVHAAAVVSDLGDIRAISETTSRQAWNRHEGGGGAARSVSTNRLKLGQDEKVIMSKWAESFPGPAWSS